MTNKKRLSLEHFLAYRVVRFANKLSHAVSDIYTGDHGLTVAQWRVLATLAEQEGLTATQVAVQTAMDKVKVSRAITQLEARALTARTAVKKDGRAFNLSLTDAGWALYYAVVPDALKWQRRLLSEVSEQEYDTFMQVMAKLEKATDHNQVENK